jgi:hypothetical protein
VSVVRRGLVSALLVLLVVATGCSSSSSSEDEPTSAPESSPSASTSGAAEDTPAPAAPRVGSCHALTVTEATDPVDPGGPVPCRRPHTSVTMKVGQLTPVVDGHLLAVDSRTVRDQIARSCPDSPGTLVGGDLTTQRLSRFEVVWFGPSLEQADAGANWYRCDVVALRSQGQLLPLPARLKGVLDQEGALDRFGTCGTTAAPNTRGFARVVCSEPHRSRAIDVVDLPRNARYLAKDAAAIGDTACKDAASERTDGLKLTWTFEWPTRAQWAAKQRYGYCWVPES